MITFLPPISIPATPLAPIRVFRFSLAHHTTLYAVERAWMWIVSKYGAIKLARESTIQLIQPLNCEFKSTRNVLQPCPGLWRRPSIISLFTTFSKRWPDSLVFDCTPSLVLRLSNQLDDSFPGWYDPWCAEATVQKGIQWQGGKRNHLLK